MAIKQNGKKEKPFKAKKKKEKKESKNEVQPTEKSEPRTTVNIEVTVNGKPVELDKEDIMRLCRDASTSMVHSFWRNPYYLTGSYIFRV